jgi:hypothetical protein
MFSPFIQTHWQCKRRRRNGGLLGYGDSAFNCRISRALAINPLYINALSLSSENALASKIVWRQAGLFRDPVLHLRTDLAGVVESEDQAGPPVSFQDAMRPSSTILPLADPLKRGQNAARLLGRETGHSAATERLIEIAAASPCSSLSARTRTRAPRPWPSPRPGITVTVHLIVGYASEYKCTVTVISTGILIRVGDDSCYSGLAHNTPTPE